MNTIKSVQNTIASTISTMTLPKTYKAAVCKEKDKPLVIEEIELKMPADGELLVKVEACGVCHSDQAVQGGHFGNSFPRIPGHEYIGHVAAVGAHVKEFKVGDRVGGAWHGGHDGVCKACKRGLFQMCDNETINGVMKDGGYAEYAILNHEAAVKIPKGVDAAAYAPLLCAGVTVYNSMRHEKVMPGELIAVQGLGGLGHLAVQYANKMGYDVVALSNGSAKEKFARELGAKHYIDTSKGDAAEKLQKMGGARLILSTAPNGKAIEPLLAGLGLQGKLLIVSAAGPITIDTMAMITKGLSVGSWPSGHSLDTEEAIAFAEAKDINCMVEKFPLEKVNEALEHMSSGKVRFRSVLTIS